MIRRLLLINTVLFAIVACSPAPEKTEKPAGIDSLKWAITALEKKILDDPDDPGLLRQRAQLYLLDRQMEKALADINKAITLDPGKIDGYILLSDIYLLMGQPDNCGEALDKSLTIEPDNTVALLKKAKLNLIVKDYNKTFTIIKTLLALDPINPPAYYLRAIAFLEHGDTAYAVQDLMKAVDQDQKYYDAYIQLGELYSIRKDRLAESYLKNALNIRPQSREALYMLGMHYQGTEQFEKAIATYQNLSKVDTVNSAAYYNTGYIYLVYLKDFTKAAFFFSEALKKDSGYFEAWYNRGFAYELLGEYQKAYDDYQKALKLKVNYEKAIQGLNRLDKIGFRR